MVWGVSDDTRGRFRGLVRMVGMTDVVRTTLIVGLEVHVQLATRTKMFSTAPNPAHVSFEDAAPNTLIDPVVLGLPGALPLLNSEAVAMAARVGLALGCSIATFTKWDRKNYFYPDLPKGYQISQYDLPLCFDGGLELPLDDEGARTRRIGIIRAHLEEDAGKLLHEAPGGAAIDHSIVDYNRAGAPLLEIVTQPDFRDADEVVRFAQLLRGVCRWLGVTEGVMQKGHMRFEPNINLHIELAGGRVVKTPIVEIKNLNSFRALRGAIEYEAAAQVDRWREDGRVMGPGAKSTRGWDDVRGVTTAQREKEDAHEYRYFPEPDLPPLTLDEGAIARLREALPEPPHERTRRYVASYALGGKEAAALTEDRAVSDFFDACVEEVVRAGVGREPAGKKTANLLLQSGAKRANERGALISDLGVTPAQVAGVVSLREKNEIGSSAADELFGLLCDAPGVEDARALAERKGLLQVMDESALRAWCEAAIAANPKSAEDYRAGKQAAIGALVGGVMRISQGRADAKAAREALMEMLGG
ncbi:MAG: Asp-tRNA(Asn)/Glu-tRNA(Gln) amidotransferase subunit GatB [Phycisphaerales bacterium]|nr:MAG: Asp-tRNA(Asn)/Glu-tRNA(Gln) amidotransferase subunit GatB [Phycisphaerales bacterium]